MDSKKIVRSKSNTAEAKVKKNFHKICKSNATIHSHVVKKRGVYVESSSKGFSDDEKSISRKKSKRSKLGQKNNSSALLIVSTSSVSKAEDKEAMYIRKIRLMNKKQNTVSRDTKYIPHANSRNKVKKSDVNLDNKLAKNELPQIKPKNEVKETPKKYTIKDVLEENMRNMEAKNKKVTIENEKQDETENKSPNDLKEDLNEALRNILLDHLESTMQACNFENNNLDKESKSRTKLVPREKSDVKKAKRNVNIKNIVSSHEIDLNGDSDLEIRNYSRNISNNFNESPILRVTKKPRLKKHVNYEFLNDLKRRLIRTPYLREPQNLFEALKRIAKNKRRTEIAYQFNGMFEHKAANNQCVFNSKSLSNKKIKKYRK